MATAIVMPRLGDFMTEGVVAWSKSSGDVVKQGEPLAEIESEKLNYDLEASEAGVLHTVADAGSTVPVDGIIGYILAEGEEPPAPEQPKQAVQVAAGAVATPRTPRVAAAGGVRAGRSRMVGGPGGSAFR